jgi:hypothetical protein
VTLLTYSTVRQGPQRSVTATKNSTSGRNNANAKANALTRSPRTSQEYLDPFHITLRMFNFNFFLALM